MLAQSYLYLTNRKYATSLANLDSLMEEVSSFYSQSETPRKVVIVSMDGVPAEENSIKDVVVKTLKKFNPTVTTDSDMSSILEFKNMADVNSKEYIENDNKEFLVFVGEDDLYTLYFKYVDSVFSSVAGYDVDRLKDYAMHVLRRDIDFSFTDFLTDDYIKGIIDKMFAGDRFETCVAPSSKCFSYDLLFYMNDHMADNTVSLPILKEKFSIHSVKLVHEMVQQMAIKTSFVSPIMGILDYLASTGDTTYDRDTVIRGVWQNENRSEALYLLNGFIQYVETVPGLVDKLKAHDSWEYYEVWRELKRSLPLSVAFLEGGFEALNGPEMRDQWAEIEFLYRRRARIPYLLWSVKPLT